MKQIQSWIIIFLNISFLSCQDNNGVTEMKIDSFDSKVVSQVFETRVGIKPPNELLNYWDENWANRERITIAYWGDFNILYPDDILKETLNAPPNYAQVNLSNAYWFEQDEGRMTRAAYDSLVFKMGFDPVLQSQDIRKWHLSDHGRHLRLSYAIAIAKPSGRSGKLFYGFNSSKEVIGVFYYPNTQIQWPIFMSKNLNELLEWIDAPLSDLDEYVTNNSHSIVRINSDPKDIISFYEDSYRKTFGDSLKFVVEEKQWNVDIFKNGRHFTLGLNDDQSYYKKYQILNTMLNLNAHHFRIPEFYSYYRVRNTYLAVLSKEQAIDFAKKGLIEIEFFNQPIDIYSPQKSLGEKQYTLKEFQNLDENSKRQFLKDFGN